MATKKPDKSQEDPRADGVDQMRRKITLALCASGIAALLGCGAAGPQIRPKPKEQWPWQGPDQAVIRYESSERRVERNHETLERLTHCYNVLSEYRINPTLWRHLTSVYGEEMARQIYAALDAVIRDPNLLNYEQSVDGAITIVPRNPEGFTPKGLKLVIQGRDLTKIIFTADNGHNIRIELTGDAVRPLSEYLAREALQSYRLSRHGVIAGPMEEGPRPSFFDLERREECRFVFPRLVSELWQARGNLDPLMDNGNKKIQNVLNRLAEQETQHRPRMWVVYAPRVNPKLVRLCAPPGTARMDPDDLVDLVGISLDGQIMLREDTSEPGRAKYIMPADDITAILKKRLKREFAE